MTNDEILKKAINKARHNGYKGIECLQLFMIHGLTNGEAFEIEKHLTIFSHEFAKAFFGCKYIDVDEHYDADPIPKGVKAIGKDMVIGEYQMTWKIRLPAWKHYLREMVLEKEPLKYLERFLDEN